MKRRTQRIKIYCSLFVLLFSLLPVGRPAAARKPDFRAVWVSTVYRLDYPAEATTSAETLRQQADEILDRSLAMGMNAVIFQVRPAADAFYQSACFPWSRYLSGTPGVAPDDGFDPLAYWVSAAHARGMELHAWLNPYRVTLSESDYASLPENHPAKVHPDWTMWDDSGNYYFNPGLPEVRELILQGAEEIARGYEVDGIHLDDYFYPTTGFDDTQAYAQYGAGFGDVGDWRRENVNMLVREMHERLAQVRPGIVFGISPAGIWANRSRLPEGSDTSGSESYFKHYADTRKWVKEGYVDYICPQIYWYIGHPQADYATLAQWWSDVVRGTGVKLYIGMADYQAGNTDATSPWHGIEAIRQQVALNRAIPEIEGEAHFRYRLMMQNSELTQFYRELYQKEESEPPAVVVPIEREVALDRVNHFAYIKGEEGKFWPERSLTRAETAVIFARLTVFDDGAAVLDGTTYPSAFADVERGSYYADAVGLMGACGFLKGYEDGTFRPGAPITRAELAALACRLAKLDASGRAAFSDVPPGHYAAGAIAALVEAGWLSGYPDGMFRPDLPITRAEAVKVINRLLARDSSAVPEDAVCPFGDMTRAHWAYDEVMEASVGHLYDFQENGEEIWTERM